MLTRSGRHYAPTGIRCYRFEAPPGFECLARGAHGDTFVSHDRREVRKYFASHADALHEARLLDRVAQLAPQYCPAPGRLLLLPGVLCMQNAGPTLQERDALMSHEERCLCLLQTIHFIALLGAEIRVDDIHRRNICVRLTGARIEVRWIDYGMWTLVEDERRNLRANMKKLLSVEVWARNDDALSALLQECEENASEMDPALVARLAAESLWTLARGLYARAPSHRAAALLADIERPQTI